MEIFKLFGSIGIKNQEANKAIDETTGKAEGSVGKFSAVFGKIGKLAAVAGKAIASGLAIGVVAIAGLTGVATKHFANYEQLVGGVETLFGAGGKSLEEYAQSVGQTVEEAQDKYHALMSAQDVVMKNSKNAYRTAGLSANAYMETVTSFSASLIQSLGGDTVAAAQKADLAITDMSDNANKMGTSIDMIQNAYQGFAKQNFTMLDNLKLGYGGTKEEMQRLLDKASEISGIKYDISSYADIVDAIHVVQTEMGITGTTAKEAASTISGSIGMAKAAWENFLTGMADPDQDFDALVGNLVDSIDIALGNIVPRIVQTLPRIVKGISQVTQMLAGYLPSILRTLLPALVSGATELFGALVATIPELFGILLSDVLPQVSAAFVTFLDGIFDKIPEPFSGLKKAYEGLKNLFSNEVVTKAIMAIVGAFAAFKSVLFVKTLIAGISAALGALAGVIGTVSAPVIGIVAAIAAWIAIFVRLYQTNEEFRAKVQAAWAEIQSVIGSAIKSVSDFVMSVFGGLVSWWNENQELIKTTAETVWNALSTVIMTVLGILGPYIQAIWENIKVVISTAWEIIKNTIETAINAVLGIVKAVMQILTGDWSGAWETIKQVVSGIWEGIKSNVSTVIGAVATIVSNMMGGISGTVSNIWNGIKDTISNAINGAKKAVSGAINAIKGFFNFSISWPHIPMPHFSITPKGWDVGDLLKGKIPKLGIEWYAKGGIMTKPTVFGMNGPNAMVGGEAGHEAILPLNKENLSQIGYAIAESSGMSNSKIEALLSNLVVLTQALLDKDTDVKLDGRSMVEQTYQEMSRRLTKEADLGLVLRGENPW